MSRVAKVPVKVPAGVAVEIAGGRLTVSGTKGSLSHDLHEQVEIVHEQGTLRFRPRGEASGATALAATTRALASNMVIGVTQGFERRLELVGVGYRAQMKGAVLNLALGYSHPIDFTVPEGVSVETPTQTEVVVRGIDKQKVGQVAATIRGFRPPEPYKGKGVRFAGEMVVRKEAKKK